VTKQVGEPSVVRVCGIDADRICRIDARWRGRERADGLERMRSRSRRGGEIQKISHESPIVSATRGRIETTSARPLDAIHGWRAIFDVVPDANSMEPISLRLFLRADGQPLTETWLYEYAPPPLNERPLQ